MKKYIPFDLFVPEIYMTDDLSISLLPVTTGKDNPYSSNGDILLAVFFSQATDIIQYLTDGSFILLETPSGKVSMKLKVENDIYTFSPLSNNGQKPIVKLKENLGTLDIVGKVIFSFHDFAGLTDINNRFREILSFSEEGVEFPDI